MLTSRSVVQLRQAALALALLGSACFDSDDKFRFAQDATTTGVPATTTTDPSTSTGEPPASSSGDAPVTCRDLVECIRECALTIDPSDPEPDLTCLLECTEDPNSSPREVYHLLQLVDCLTTVCEELGECTPPAVTSTGSDTGESSTGSSSSSTSSDDGGTPLIPPCLQCILLQVLMPDSGECSEFHMMCV